MPACSQWPCYLKHCISPNWRPTDTYVQFWTGSNDSVRHVETLTFEDFITFSTEIANVLTEHSRTFVDSSRSELLIGILWRPHILTTVAVHSVVIADLAFYPVHHTDPSRLWLLSDNLIGIISLGFAVNDSLLLPRGYSQYHADCDDKTHGVFKRKDWNLWLRKTALCNSIFDIRNSNTDLHTQRPSSRLAYIISTSGSCGGPLKLVFVADSCLTANVFDLADRLSSNSRSFGKGVLLTAPLTFDPSIVQIYFSLINNQFLLIPEEGLLLRSSSLFRLVTEAGVSLIQCTPGLWLQQSAHHQDALISKPALTVVFGGESLPTQCILDYLNRKTTCTASFYNMYGVTEVSSWATIGQLKSRRGCLSTVHCECVAPIGGATPIGVPMFATMVSLLGEAVDRVGELTVTRRHGGHAVVRVSRTSPDCKLSRAEFRRTHERLSTPSPWATGDLVVRGACGNCLWYVGRRDRMVKRFGHQICLDRLEQAINEHRPLSGKLRGCKCRMVAQSSGRTGKLIAHVAFIPRHATHSSNVKLQEQRLKLSIIGHLKKRFAPDWLPWLPTEISLRRRHLLISSHGKMESLFRYPSGSRSTLQFWRRMRSLLATATTSAHQKSILSSELTFYQLGGTSLSLMVLIDAMLHEVPQLAPLRDKLITLLLHDSLASFCRFARNLLSPNLSSVGRSAFMLRSTTQTAHLRVGKSLFDALVTDDKKVALSSMKSVWRYPLGKCIDAAALPITGNVHGQAPSVQVVIGSHSGILAAINLDTGVASTLVALNARIEAPACHVSRPGGCTVAVGTLNGDLHVVDMEAGQVVVSFDTGGAIKAAPTYLQHLGILVSGSHGRLVHALDLRSSNRRIWSVSLDRSPVVGTIAQTDSESLLAASLGGSFGLLEPRMSGRLVWQHKISSPIFAGPVVLSHPECSQPSVIVAGVSGDLTARCLNDGSSLWDYQIPSPMTIFNDPVLIKNGDCFLVPSGAGYLKSVDTRRGHLQWSLDCRRVDPPTSASLGHSLSRPAVVKAVGSDLHVVVTRSDGVILSFACPSLTSGCELDLEHLPRSTYRLPGESFSAPVVVSSADNDCLVVVGCRDDNVHCVAVTYAAG